MFTASVASVALSCGSAGSMAAQSGYDVGTDDDESQFGSAFFAENLLIHDS